MSGWQHPDRAEDDDGAGEHGHAGSAPAGGVEYDSAPLLRVVTVRAWSRLAELVVERHDRQGAHRGTQDHPREQQ